MHHIHLHIQNISLLLTNIDHAAYFFKHWYVNPLHAHFSSAYSTNKVNFMNFQSRLLHHLELLPLNTMYNSGVSKNYFPFLISDVSMLWYLPVQKLTGMICLVQITILPWPNYTVPLTTNQKFCYNPLSACRFGTLYSNNQILNSSNKS